MSEPAHATARQLTCSRGTHRAEKLMMLPAKIQKPLWAATKEEHSYQKDMPRYIPDQICREHQESLEVYYSESGPVDLSSNEATTCEDLPPSVETGSTGAFDCPCGSESEDSSAKACTTLMVLNIPNHISMKNFSDKLDAGGWKGVYNFCNIPRALSTGKNLGFAFVNFDTAKQAEAFSQDWAGQESFGKGKRLKIRPAKIQGIEANLILAQKSMKRRNTSFKPLMFF